MIPDRSQTDLTAPQQVPIYSGDLFDPDTSAQPSAVFFRAESQRTILIVDDERVTRELLSHQLQVENFKVVTAVDGSQAINIVNQSKPDLVLMDIGMPILDGYTALRMMRQLYDGSELPIIMMTSNSVEDQIAKCFDNGASDYLAKPIQRPTMIARIEAQFKLGSALSALRESEQRYVLASQGTRDGIWDWNLNTGEIYLSPRWLAMVGVDDPNWKPHGTSWIDLVFHEDRERVRSDLEAHLSGNTDHFETELRMPDQDGGFRWMLCRAVAVRDPLGIPTRIAGSLTDITEGKVADALTRLPNRVLFSDRVERCVEHYKRNASRRFAVLYIDVNDFKLINDSLGHDVGDEFLIQISERLNSGLRKSEAVLARLGGDEFGILIEGITHVEDAVHIAERIQERIKAPLQVCRREILARISIGVVCVNPNNASVDKIIREADTAMYHAKKYTDNGISVFENRMQAESAAKLEMASELKDAIRRDELSLCFQPIIRTNDMSIAGFESLIRWQHPILGKVPPSEFIPIAESNGMIIEIGNWVLRQSCLQAARWNRISKNDVIVSVNVSVRQFSGEDLLDQVADALTESELRPDQLKLEVTESLLMEKPEEMIEVLNQLKAIGVTTGIDDFGTGYSSLAYLHQMPLKVLKIDRSFVSNLADSKKHQAIVRSIIALARSLELKVIAEGIESESQAAYLQGLQCEYFQGFLYSHPVEADNALEMIENGWREGTQV